jgi:hypothetical protein
MTHLTVNPVHGHARSAAHAGGVFIDAINVKIREGQVANRP